mgnify:CR=1 FL=1
MDAKFNHTHVYELLVSREISWQSIIYDLINTEQLNPWDVDLSLLVQKYLEKIRVLEEANFFVSSKVLFAASLLLRIKSEILLNKYIRSIDEILFGKEEEKKKQMERIEIDESELPLIYPRTPLPRLKKVSLQELMEALNKAITTETRKTKREILFKQVMKEAEVVFPRGKISVSKRIREIYARILTMAKKNAGKISYSTLIGEDKIEKIAGFLPVLHLDVQKRIFLEQETHFAEIYVWLYKHYLANRPKHELDEENPEKIHEEIKTDEAKKLDELEQELYQKAEEKLEEEVIKEEIVKERVQEINQDFENPLADAVDEALME